MTKPLNRIGPILRKLRNERGLSQAKLAAKCQLGGWDITREGIAKIEGGTRHIDDIELTYLRKTLGCGWADLLGKV
jgi:transcriptional regulator with XRE-family HTH domain